jgi:D-methionine transport system substrate-binding protein
MKRLFVSMVAAVLAVGVLAGCGGSKAPEGGTDTEGGAERVTLKVGATPVPHAEILNAIKSRAAEEGIDLEVIEFTDYVKPNIALAEKELDANFFQHTPYLETFAADRNLDLVSAGPVHLEPLGFYSIKVQGLDELADGATVAIPDDPTNGGRALKLLADQGLLTLKEGVGTKATPQDIVENPKGIEIQMLTAEMLPRTLQDVDAAVINTNYYLEAEENLGVEAAVLARESAEDNPYANIVAVRAGDETRPEIVKLMELLQSEEVKAFIESEYGGAIVPAF